jgi:pimeloyl-ACP methyl ester carboxylesterase
MQRVGQLAPQRPAAARFPEQPTEGHSSTSDRTLASRAPMELVDVGGVTLEYTVEGVGDPVVLVHAGVVADFFQPLVAPLAGPGRFRVVHYHRVGYGDSSRPGDGDAGIAEQARQCQALLQKLGVDRAHVVGHSSGGLIATQLALDAPELVGTLALLEPVDLEVPSAAEFGQQVLGAAFQRYAVGDKEGAVDAFMRGVCSPDHRPLLDRVLGPAAFRQAVTDADTFFGAEAPAGMQWRWDQIDPGRLSQPLLAVVGADSDTVSPVSAEGHEALLRRLPQAERYVLPGATHLLQLQNAEDLGVALTDFFDRHPLNQRP